MYQGLEANQLKVDSSPAIFFNWVKPGDNKDFYNFELQESSEISLDLDELTANANLFLGDPRGQLIASSRQPGRNLESITTTLEPDSYTVLVQGSPAATDYNLTLSAEFTPYFTEYIILPTLTPLTDRIGVPTGDERIEGGEAVAIFDANLDGLLDVAIVNGSSYYFLFLNTRDDNGEYYFTGRATYIGEEEDGLKNVPKSLGLHDFNGDGILDLYLNNGGRGTLKARNPRDLDNILSPGNIRDGGLFRDSRFRTQINQGDGTFRYEDLGVDGDGTTRSSVFADFDGDGNFDAYLSNAPYFGIWWAGSPVPNQLYPGRDDGTFGPDIIDTVVVNDPGDLFKDEFGRANKDFKGVVVRDFDNDGKPDIIASAFADIWDNVTKFPYDTAVPEGALVDLDGDGLPDGGYQGDWERGILVLRNVSTPGNIQFEDVSELAIDNALGNSDQMHVYVSLPADIDGDADLDLLVSGPRNFIAHNSEAFDTDILRIYRNDSTPGDIRLTNITEESGLNLFNDNATLPAPYEGGIVIPGVLEDKDYVAVPMLSAGAALDIDNDGDLDWVAVDRQFLLSEGPLADEELSLWLFLNDGTGHFSLVPHEIHGLSHTARDLSYGDLNGDGRLDIVTVNGSTPGEVRDDNNYVFFNNIQNDNHFVFINVSEKGNQLGIGAKVTVYEAGSDRILGYDEVRTDFGYRSKRSTTLHFGLDQVNSIDILVETQQGVQKMYQGLEANQTYTLILEDDGAGNDRKNALDIGLLDNNPFPQNFSDAVGLEDRNDFYRFELSSESEFELVLDELTANVSVFLADEHGNRITSSLNPVNSPESINTTLMPGTYFVRVRSADEIDSPYHLTLSAQVVVDDQVVSGETRIVDPEFDPVGSLVTWTAQGDLWVAPVDPQTGDFILEEAQLIDTGLAPPTGGVGRSEWAYDVNGSQIVYTKDINGEFFLGRARQVDGVWEAGLLLDENGAPIPGSAPYGALDPEAESPRISYISGTNRRAFFWLELDNPANRGRLPGSGFRWVVGEPESIVLSVATGDGFKQLFKYNTDTDTLTQLTFDAETIKRGAASFMWRAPEFNNELVLMATISSSEPSSFPEVIANGAGQDFVDKEIALYRNINGEWVKFNSISSPLLELPFVQSPEPFVVGNKSYISLVFAKEDTDGSVLIDGTEEVWVVGIDSEENFFRKISIEGSPHNDPEYLVTNENSFVFYTAERGVIRRALTGLTPPSNSQVNDLVQVASDISDTKTPGRADSSLPSLDIDDIPIQVISDIPYTTIPEEVDPSLLSLDVYSISDEQRRPVIVYVHGGGLIRGNKDILQFSQVPEVFLDEGYIFVPINYRLTPNAEFPMHVEDVAKAIDWTYENIDTYGGDPNQIYLMGHSAGAYLSTLITTDERYLSAEGFTLSVIDGVVALDTNIYDLPLLATVFDGSLPFPYNQTFGTDPVFWEYASPINYIEPDKGIPGTFIAYTGQQQTQEKFEMQVLQAEQYLDKLLEAGVKAEILPSLSQTHTEIISEFGNEGDFVTAEVLEFLAEVASQDDPDEKILIDLAGNNRRNALDVGFLDSTSLPQTFSDAVGLTDHNDFYRFELLSSSILEISLDNLIANANVSLKDEADNLIASSRNREDNDERIITSLAPGTYYVRVSSVTQADTSYDLTFSTQSVVQDVTISEPSPTLPTAENIFHKDKANNAIASFHNQKISDEYITTNFALETEKVRVSFADQTDISDMATLSAQSIVDDAIVSDPTITLPDPEFNQLDNRVTWQDTDGNLWVAHVDPLTGSFGGIDPLTGNFIAGLETIYAQGPIDTNLALQNISQGGTGNGPEWVYTKNGADIVYTKEDDQGNRFIGRAQWNGTEWSAGFLTDEQGSLVPGWLPSGTLNLDNENPLIKYVRFSESGAVEQLWRELDNSTVGGLLPGSGGRWVQALGERAIIRNLVDPTTGLEQYYKYDVYTEELTQLTQDNILKAGGAGFMWYSPEYDDLVLLSSEKTVDEAGNPALLRDQLGLYREIDGNWTRFNTISSPSADLPYIHSPEPFVYQGKSYISLLAVKANRNGKKTFNGSEVWVVGVDPDQGIADKVSIDIGNGKLNDPESFITEAEGFIYYTEITSEEIRITHRADLDLGEPDAVTDSAGNTLENAYEIGTLDNSPVPQTFLDWVGGTDPKDYYTFTLSAASTVELTLSELAANANLFLGDEEGVELARSTNTVTESESIVMTLEAGNYSVLVRSNNADNNPFTAYNLTLSAQFAVNEAIVSNPKGNMPDPEFNPFSSQVIWQDRQERLWIADVDPVTGEFDLAGATLIDTELAPISSFRQRTGTGNGPEPALGLDGLTILYTKALGSTQDTWEVYQAQLTENGWETGPLPGAELLPGNGNGLNPIGTLDPLEENPRIQYVLPSAPDEQYTLAWRDLNQANGGIISEQPEGGSRWVNGENAQLVYTEAVDDPQTPEVEAITQVFLYDTATDTSSQLTSSSTYKDKPFMWWAPEYGEKLLLAGESTSSGQNTATKLGIYRNIDGNWTLINEIVLPTEKAFIRSAEPFVFNGQSYISMLAEDDKRQPSEVWIAAATPEEELYRQVIDPNVSLVRNDPEPVVTEGGVFIYYTERGSGVVYRADTGLGLPEPLTLTGNSTDDRLVGDAGADTITGGDGDDTLRGGAGADVIVGGAGNDSIFGDAGDDILTGAGDGDIGLNTEDILNGGKGGDIFVLGTSTDIFYNGNGANDFARIEDFTLGEDRLQVKGSSEDYTATNQAGGAVLLLASTNEEIAFLENIQAGNLTANDLVLV